MSGQVRQPEHFRKEEFIRKVSTSQIEPIIAIRFRTSSSKWGMLSGRIDSSAACFLPPQTRTQSIQGHSLEDTFVGINKNDIRLSVFALLLYAFVSNWLRHSAENRDLRIPPCMMRPPRSEPFHDCPRFHHLQTFNYCSREVIIASERASMHQMLRPVRFSVAREWYGV